MSDSVLPPVLAELRQARGLDLSDYRRATLERHGRPYSASYRRESLDTTQLGILNCFFQPMAAALKYPKDSPSGSFLTGRPDLRAEPSPSDSVFGSFDQPCRKVFIYFSLKLQPRFLDKL